MAANDPGSEAPAVIQGYHAHVYYDPNNLEPAQRLRDALGARFNVRLGRWHAQPVGPHLDPMYQVAFERAEFARLLPWLMLNHEGLSVLIHPLTPDPYADHIDHALWLGAKLKLNAETLKHVR